jgi:cobalt-zinc-cadmium efflux system protein
VNLVSFWILSRSDRDNLNVRAALLHVLGDLLGSVAAIAAAGIILATGWTAADPLLSALVALIILRAAWRVVKDSGRILMEAAPRGVDPGALKTRLLAIEGVAGIAHVHLWAIAENRRMATLEAMIAPSADAAAVGAAIKRVLREEFAVGHATVEIAASAGTLPVDCR